MNYFLQFVWNRRVFLLFVLLQGLAITMTLRANSYQRSAVMTSSNRISGWVLESYNDFIGYIRLREINQNLAEENATLRSALKSSYFSIYAERDSVVDTLYRQRYQYIAAEVINSSIHKRNNYLTLNRGRVHGVAEDMGVISKDGVIGVVTDVSDYFATVIPLIHGRTRLSGKFLRNEYFGTVSWQPHQNYHQARLSDIPRQAHIEIGDTVVSDERSHLFPTGVIIGTVDSTFIERQDQFYEVDLKLAADFANIDKVYIVVDLLKEDLLELENKIRYDE